MDRAKTPTVAIARVLRSLGLTQRGIGRDFQVRGVHVKGERVGTTVSLLTLEAERIVAANADRIEELADSAGFPFRVDINTLESGATLANVTNTDVECGKRRRAAVQPVEAPKVQAPAVRPVVPTYSTVRRLLLAAGVKVSVSQRNGRNWTEGAAIRTTNDGVVVEFVVGSSHWVGVTTVKDPRSSGLAQVREVLGERFSLRPMAGHMVSVTALPVG